MAPSQVSASVAQYLSMRVVATNLSSPSNWSGRRRGGERSDPCSCVVGRCSTARKLVAFGSNGLENCHRRATERPRHVAAWDRHELGALLVPAGLGSARDHAPISLLAMNGSRISEALGANIEDLDVARGRRTLRVVRKGGKQVTVPLAPRTARALDLYIAERVNGSIFQGGW